MTMQTQIVQRRSDSATMRAHAIKALTMYELPPEQPPLWTQDQAIAFEAARECISHMMAIHMADFYAEEDKEFPDAKRLEALKAAVHALWEERSEMRVLDDARVAHVRAHYGAIIRARMAEEEPKISA